VCVCVCVCEVSITTTGLHEIVRDVNKVCVCKIQSKNDYKNTKNDRQKQLRATRNFLFSN
jgi:hypothetical protein